MIKKNLLFISIAIFTAAALLSIGSGSLYAQDNPVYAHISLLEGEAFIKKTTDAALPATINMPLVPGDILRTGEEGRCEILFDNGTLIRLDKNTELQLDTVLSNSLTTRDKITTLQLNSGQIFSMNQLYKKEIFQVITPVAAIKMITRSTNYITVDENGTTYLFVKRGKVGILYGKDREDTQKTFLSAGKSCRVTTNHELEQAEPKKNIEFFAWNEYVNKNFKDIHYGISKIPPVIYRHSPGIVHFAERWSTRLGVWEYNELFGYVWRPNVDTFKDRRPFWDANFVEINNKLIIVPNQPWAWVPAHLGTWFFSKTYGWTWIPGDSFSPGICSVGLLPGYPYLQFGSFYCSTPRCYSFSTLGYWAFELFGNEQLLLVYSSLGQDAWKSAYELTMRNFRGYGYDRGSKPPFHKAPENIREFFKKIDRIPVEKVKEHLSLKEPGATFTLDDHKIIKTSQTAGNKAIASFFEKHNAASAIFAPGNTTIAAAQITPTHGISRAAVKKDGNKLEKTAEKNREARTIRDTNKDMVSYRGRDWNPDARWAQKVGVNILYSSKENMVVCPELRLSSTAINDIQRNRLRRSVVDRSYLVYGNSSNNHGSYNGGGITPQPAVLQAKANAQPDSGSSSHSSNSSSSSSQPEKK